MDVNEQLSSLQHPRVLSLSHMHFSHSQHFHDFTSLSNFRWCSLQSSLSLQPLAHIEFHSLRDLTLDTRFDAHLASSVGHALLGKAVFDSI